eukprot:EG_transcript_11052
MEVPMPRNDTHDIAVPVKEHSPEDPKADQKELLLQMEDPVKARELPLAVRIAGLTAVLGVSVVITLVLTWYSKHSSHIQPFTTGQVAVVLTMVFFVALWLTVQAVAVAMAAPCHGFWQAYRHHKGRLVSEELGKYITAAAEFALLLAYFYICDRTDLFSRGEKKFDPDQYWFIWAAIVGASLFTIHRVHNVPASGHVQPLQRDQTEEWKGCMQIQFLMYHYFVAVDYYNAIRCYIAAYVWMTGFGNFSFYYIKRDFGLQRFCAMQWRLNFFVFWCCLLLNNDYMLYYICMLHTTFTVVIYVALGLFQDLNYSYLGIRAKFVIMTALVAVIWDIPGVFEVLWTPLRFLVDYQGSLHEWAFRSKLDHLIWIPGMLTAFTHPNSDAFLEWLDTRPFFTQYTIKALVVAVCLMLGHRWYTSVFALKKLEYNQLHPFTSFIPITLYIILRNISSRLRRYHLGFFAWMGKITLETYICQFHVWMLTTGPNG